jgi:hypothetical protein
VTAALSLVVVAYDMVRELPRTLRSLRPDHQRDLDVDDYEVIVVDNGSPSPIDPALLASFPGRLRVERLDPAPPSPAHAANVGVGMAEGDLVGLVVDGARIASPGLLAHARLAARVAPRPVIATLGWHLGPVRHMDAEAAGYDGAAEDRLLASCGWEGDGYALFDVSTLAGSSGRGWFGPMGESSALFMPAAMWRELRGLDEGFAMPGGGLVNHDLYRRACGLPDACLVVLLGEGTFHQVHGGAATSRAHTWEEMHADYVSRRGEPYRPPANEPLYLGRLPAAALRHVEESARLAIARRTAGTSPV